MRQFRKLMPPSPLLLRCWRRHLVAAGAGGPQVIEFGPTNATIHKVNECLPVVEVEPLQKIYRRILELVLLKR